MLGMIVNAFNGLTFVCVLFFFIFWIRLGGKKVGLFSTRTPHRPNSIGLTVVKIERVEGRYIEISGHDLVNGTPVLDVKPYVFSDFVPSYVCPHWVADKADVVDVERKVQFDSSALKALGEIVQNGHLSFYKSLEEIQDAIRQVLVLDIRSVHQGRGKASDAVFSCRLDRLVIEFRTLEDTIQVIRCSRNGSETEETD